MEVNHFVSLGENKLCFIFFYVLVIAGGCRASCRSLNLLSFMGAGPFPAHLLLKVHILSPRAMDAECFCQGTVCPQLKLKSVKVPRSKGHSIGLTSKLENHSS